MKALAHFLIIDEAFSLLLNSHSVIEAFSMISTHFSKTFVRFIIPSKYFCIAKWLLDFVPIGWNLGNRCRRNYMPPHDFLSSEPNHEENSIYFLAVLCVWFPATWLVQSYSHVKESRGLIVVLFVICCINSVAELILGFCVQLYLSYQFIMISMYWLLYNGYVLCFYIKHQGEMFKIPT